jgi:hypothetical protein
MQDIFTRLAEGQEAGTLSKGDAKLAKKFFKTLQLLANDPRHNSLQSHEIEPLSRRFGQKVFQSYLENRTPSAGRLYWVYGPNTGEITVVGLEPHPEDQKRGGYDRVRLSEFPPD